MLFNSLVFLYAFLPLAYWIFRFLRGRTARYIWMTAAGYLFYSFWNPKFCLLMAFSTLVSYLAGLGFLATDHPVKRRFLLVIPVGIDLALLAFFKYADFALGTFNEMATWMHLTTRLRLMEVVLPVGISFYTFHTITYIVDSYRRTITPTRNFFEFSCYVSLFTQLVAGPIVRFREVKDDLERIESAEKRADGNGGWSLFCIGMAKKVLLADTIAAFINPALMEYKHLGTVESWVCMLGYSYQLYFDFSGYSDMAMGLGRLFGIRIPQNFNSPYKAADVRDFWRRWHISLSTCLRDYLYIPLGGRGTAWSTGRNIMITMLLGGVWHGANWTFVVWGAYHGLLLVLHRSMARPWEKLPLGVRRASTFLLVLIGWVFFRSTSFEMAFALLGAMFSWTPFQGMTCFSTLVVLLVLATVVVQGSPNTCEMKHDWRPVLRIGIAMLLLASVFVMYSGQETAFLYFQF